MAEEKKTLRQTVGTRVLEEGKTLYPILDSTDIYLKGDGDELRSRLERDGYIFVRGLVQQKTAVVAQMKLLHHLKSKGLLHTSASINEGRMIVNRIKGFVVDAESGGVVGDREPECTFADWKKIGNSNELISCYAGSDLERFCDLLFGSNSKNKKCFDLLPSCTWMRMKGSGETTVEHADLFYFKENTNIFSTHWPTKYFPKASFDHSTCHICQQSDKVGIKIFCDLCKRGFHGSCLKPKVTQSQLKQTHEWFCSHCIEQPFNFYTCWINLGNCSTINEGGSSLCLVPGSHKIPGFNKPLKGLVSISFLFDVVSLL